MNYSVLLFNGLAVRETTENYELLNISFSQSGYIYSFDYKKKVNNQEITKSFTLITEFKKVDEEKQDAIAGYYDFEFYRAYLTNNTSFDDLIKTYFNSIEFENAKKGDLLEVKALHPLDFNEYYNMRLYRFKIFDEKKLYRKIEDYPTINADENSENYSIFIDYHVHYPSMYYPSYFYNKNFSSKLQLSSWDALINGKPELEILSIDKSLLDYIPTKVKFAKITTYICWKITRIVKHALPVLAIQNVEYIKNALLAHKNGNSTNYNNLTEVDQIIANLIYSWGLLENDHFNDMPALIGDTPDLREHLAYYSNLDYFFNGLAYYQETDLFPPISDQNVDSKRRIKYLLNLDDNAFSILPKEQRKEIVDVYVKKATLEEAEQRIVVKLVNSFSNINDANYFLNYLLITDGLTTNFEKIYTKLDDARLERYTIINWFVDGQTNKKFFVFLVYEMWKVSNFNPLYIPSGVITNDTVNPDCFFYQTGTVGGDQYIAKYNEQGILISGSDGYLEFEDDLEFFRKNQQENISSTSTYSSPKLSPKLSNNFVNVNIIQIRNDIQLDENNMPFYVPNTELLKTYKYHLYQPIYPVAYVHDWELRIPQATIPAFLFMYADEFKRIKELDAALNFALEATIEVGLFFIFGGATAFRHITNYRHFTKLKNSYRTGYSSTSAGTFHLPPGVAEAEIALYFRAEGAVTEIVSVSFGVLGSLFNYYAQHIDPETDEGKLVRDVSNCFMLLALATGLMSGMARQKATKIADEIVNNNKFFTLPEGVRNAMTAIQSKSSLRVQSFQTALNSAYPSGSNLVANFFSTLPSLDKKLLFLREFKNYFKQNADGSFTFFADFERLNDLTVLNRWRDMQILNIPFRSNLSIITNADRSAALLRYYPPPIGLRKVLEELTENQLWRFLDEMGDITTTNFNKFVQDPTLINKWFKYYDDAVLQGVFKNLGEDNMIKFIERYGDISEEAFRNLKATKLGDIEIPIDVKFNRLIDFPDATHDMAYFNNRRVEMLPPNFVDSKTNKMIRLHEVDNYIELELHLSKKLRASKKHEAGDLIDDATGFSYDTMGVPYKVVTPWTENGMTSFNHYFGKYKDSITDHFDKINKTPALDYVVIDYKYFDEISLIIDNPNPNFIRNLIDDFLNQNHNEQIDKLIKLNY